MDADDIVLERPIVATLVVALVAAVVYVGIQLVLDGSVAPAETASFVLIFTIIYVAGTRYLRDQAQTDPPDAERADAPDDAATADSETAGESGPTDAAE